VTEEEHRLAQAQARTVHWRRWGPFLSERQWGTVREDYSANGDAWNYFPHDHARSRAYRWGEDGLLGISDNHQRLCFALALWNGRDPVLKERLFGVTGPQGNHGEDVKELYFYLDATPTYSYLKGLYKYPQAAFPYQRLLDENARRSRGQPEFELIDTGCFDDDRYFDVQVEYAKATLNDLLIRITVTNRGPSPAPLDLLPTLWFRNTWSWEKPALRPRLRRGTACASWVSVRAEHPTLGNYCFYAPGPTEVLFTENVTNRRRLYDAENPEPFVKDAFHDFVVDGKVGAVNPAREGTKAAPHYRLLLQPGQPAALHLRLCEGDLQGAPLGEEFDRMFATRVAEADAFYASLIPGHLDEDATSIVRQALAGLLWSKQWYHYDVRRWLAGDPDQPSPPPGRRHGRNHAWTHLYNEDVVSMPDKWEYPWYAAWDLAFHTVALAMVDPEYAKDQLILFLREWYMHPDGQLPAYEWALGDVNPPVHAWAALRVYEIDKARRGTGDSAFLKRVFHKLLLNFTWWVNRKDQGNKNVFEGGFLGLDNIGLFDRSAPLPVGGSVEQSDGTAWVGAFCLTMLSIAATLAREDPVYEDIASKFFEHFVYISHAMNNMAGEGIELWDKRDGFFYDVLLLPDGRTVPVRARSMVGLMPLIAVMTLEPDVMDRLPTFSRRMMWFLQHRPLLGQHVSRQETPDGRHRWLLALVSGTRLGQVLRYMLDEREFLSTYGLRSLSRYHRDHPFTLTIGGQRYAIDYEGGESTTGMFGGNSNWRGPVWFPLNYVIITALQRFDSYYGARFTVECPTGSGQFMSLAAVASELSRRLTRLFLRDGSGRRPAHGTVEKFRTDVHWRELVLFYEYFHGDTGAGLGASHQTGWTALVAKLFQ
jgi:Mannosylglycerate hydrolase MGH1-like glycoside hydrolase domain